MACLRVLGLMRNRDKVNQLAEPFDINGVKNSFAETLSEIVCKSLSNLVLHHFEGTVARHIG